MAEGRLAGAQYTHFVFGCVTGCFTRNFPAKFKGSLEFCISIGLGNRTLLPGRCCDQSARQRNLFTAGRMHRNLSENGTKTPSEHFFARFADAFCSLGKTHIM